MHVLVTLPEFPPPANESCDCEYMGKAMEFIESWKSESNKGSHAVQNSQFTTIQYWDHDCVLKALTVKCCFMPWTDTLDRH